LIKLWNMDGKIIGNIPAESTDEMHFNPDGTMLAIVSNEQRLLTLWDIKGERIKSFSEPLVKATGDTAAFSPDGKLVAAATTEGLKVWNLETFREMADLRSEPWQRVCAFTKDGKQIISAADDGRIRIWDAISFKLINQFQADEGFIGRISLHPSGKIIAVSNFVFGKPELHFVLWDLNGNRLKTFKDASGVAFSPKGDCLVITGGGNVDLYSITSQNTIGELRQQIKGTWAPVFSSDGNFLFFFAGTSLVRYDLRTGMEIKRFETARRSADIVTLNPAGTVLLASFQTELAIWDVASLYLKDKLYIDVNESGISLKRVVPPVSYTDFFTVLDFSPDGKILAAKKATGGSYLLETSGWTVLRKLEPATNLPKPPNHRSSDPTAKLVFSPDGQNIIGVASPNVMGIWRVEDGRPTSLFALHENIIMNFTISPDGKLAATSALDGVVRIWDIHRDTMTASFIPFQNMHGSVEKLFFTHDGTLIIAPFYFFPLNANAYKTGLWSAKGELLKYLNDDAGELYSYIYDPMPEFMAEKYENQVRLWNTRTKESVMLLTSGNEWLVSTPDGYFDASPHGGELVAMVKGLEVYGIDQFAVRNNRPDLILERMGLGTPERIDYYNMLYQKRLKKLSLTEAALSSELHVPEAKITGVKREGKFVDVSFFLSDGKYLLKRYEIYVNDVPVFGSARRWVGARTFAGMEKVELTPGNNKIELSVMNAVGVESYRAQVNVEYDGKEKGELYYLAFGASKYKDPELNLNYADKDINDLTAIISKMRSGFADIHVKTFLNSEVTAENIRKAKDFLKDARVDDTVILAIAGHGGYDKGGDAKYYFVAYETDVSNLRGTGVDFESIEDLLSGIKPRRKLFLMDTCESGEMDEDIYEQSYVLADARGIKPRAYRKPLKARGGGDGKERGYVYEKDRFIYNDLSRRTGAIVFSSSKGGELSYESSVIRNGFFTRAVINALTSKAADKNGDGKIDSGELRDFVSNEVAEDTGGLQHPTVDRDNLFQQIEFPLNVDAGIVLEEP